MPRYILVPSTDAATDLPVLAMAVRVARMTDGHVAVLHIRPDVHEQIATMAPDEVRAVSGLGERLEHLEHETDSRERLAEHSWQAFCAREHISVTEHAGAPGVTSQWLLAIGVDADRLARYGRSADLIVIGRARPDGGIALDRLEVALMATGRPVLITPSPAADTVGTTIAIAWTDTPEAARAVHNAAPFIDRAQRVVIFTVEEHSRDHRAADRLAHALRWRNPKVLVRRLQREHRVPAEIVLEAAKQEGADLLVMGGYGHGRLREAVFGGFTRHVLEKADLPVLISH